MTPEQRRSCDTARMIGNYYLAKNVGDYEKTETEIRNLGITFIEVFPCGKQTVVRLKLGRVGLFIGKRGENIDQLNRYLNSNLVMQYCPTEYHIRIEEDDTVDKFIPYDDSSNYEDCDFEYASEPITDPFDDDKSYPY